MSLHMSRKSRLILRAVMILLVVVLLLNIAWFIWREVSYRRYVTDETEATSFSSVWIPRYYLKDVNGYEYNVKYPNYASFTGNLAVSVPSDDPFGDSLIIWPRLFSADEYGVMIDDNGIGCQIYIDSLGNAIDPEYVEVVARHTDTVQDLLNRATDKWPALLSGAD